MRDLEIVSSSFGEGTEAATARIERIVGERLFARIGRPYAPGTRLRARLTDGRQLGLKVLRCVRSPSGFELEVRTFDAPAAIFRDLAAALADSAGELPGAATSGGARAPSDS